MPRADDRRSLALLSRLFEHPIALTAGGVARFHFQLPLLTAGVFDVQPRVPR